MGILLFCIRVSFYSHPYTRGDHQTVERWKVRLHVSTHTPTRGATLHSIQFFLLLKCFYSHPYTRGDHIDYVEKYALTGFYSHPYTRGDVIGSKVLTTLTVSTHTPTRGATISFYIHCPCFMFLLTPLHEGRRNPLEPFSHFKSFLLTPLHEGRRDGVFINPADQLRFYSHPYTRGDAGFSLSVQPYNRFYSHPYTRGDYWDLKSEQNQNGFYSHPYTRGDCISSSRNPHCFVSTHTPTRGATSLHILYI